ncbi:MAG: hypothetical protein R3B13_19800 [Polyangiaceae bacterium]
MKLRFVLGPGALVLVVMACSSSSSKSRTEPCGGACPSGYVCNTDTNKCETGSGGASGSGGSGASSSGGASGSSSGGSGGSGATPGSGGTSGAGMDGGSADGGGADAGLCGGATCGGYTLDNVLPVAGCCTEATCGILVNQQISALLGGTPQQCAPINAPGANDSNCPDLDFTSPIDQSKVTFYGCCRPDSTCGTLIDLAQWGGPNLGCADAWPAGSAHSCTPGN